jgi:hypothetical protein
MNLRLLLLIKTSYPGVRICTHGSHMDYKWIWDLQELFEASS